MLLKIIFYKDVFMERIFSLKQKGKFINLFYPNFSFVWCSIRDGGASSDFFVVSMIFSFVVPTQMHLEGRNCFSLKGKSRSLRNHFSADTIVP